MYIRRIIVLVILLQVSNIAISQQDTLVVKPGSKLLNGSIIKPYTNKWKVTYITPKGKLIPNKIWTDYGQIIELEGKKYFHRVQDLYDPQMNLQDTWINMVEHKSLTPVSFSTLRPDGKFSHYQYDGNSVKGRSNVNSKDTTISRYDVDLGQKVFDWNLYGMLLVGLQFKEGLVAKMPFYSAQTNSLSWLSIHVVSKESMTLPNKEKITVWKVDTNQNLTFWVSQSMPYVIKLELKFANKAKLLWEVI